MSKNGQVCLPVSAKKQYTASGTTENKGHRHWCAALGAEVQGHRPKTANANLDCAVFENALFSPIPDCEKSTEQN